jgi:hypothetical protein
MVKPRAIPPVAAKNALRELLAVEGPRELEFVIAASLSRDGWDRLNTQNSGKKRVINALSPH